MRRAPFAHLALLLAALVALQLAPVSAIGAGAVIEDVIDQQSLVRVMFLCQWKSSHEVPESAPIPAVCKSGAVSIADALLQDKQWWTFWVRLNSEQAVKANQQFSADLAGFQARQRLNPALAAQLLPPSVKLPKEDWRVRVVHDLVHGTGTQH
ncbi:MAG TPA: hypothetical protein VGV09_04295 [Steroidobacteraceae bacterium]|nr:hypothetical protein [Steroidobacteraceae bacterium]